MSKKIFVTRPNLPEIEELIPLLRDIWESKVLTNGGPYHQKLEKELCSFLGIENISLFNNGTIALITALKALNIENEVITTPYSFVATSNSLIWNNIKPVFVDIDPNTFNIDPKKIRAAITPNTSAILAVHCYGLPCNIAEIAEIAKEFNLKVIYDAAHAFYVTLNHKSILNAGDLSVLSFHATKVFNTFEGGAIIANTLALKNDIDNLKNFGFTGETTVSQIGINGKMSELNAAIGTLQLLHVKKNIASRKRVAAYYNEGLKKINGIEIPTVNFYQEGNFSYYPILIRSNYRISRDSLYQNLKDENIFCRRYFYPLITDFEAYKNQGITSDLVNSKKVSSEILCLPIYPELETPVQDKIISMIKSYA